MLVLKALPLGPVHGWGITERLEQASKRSKRTLLVSPSFRPGRARGREQWRQAARDQVRSRPLEASAEIAYWIAAPAMGCGYATEAGRAILDLAFDGLSVHRVQGRHFTRHAASGRVMQNLGMRYEGVMRGRCVAVRAGRSRTSPYGLLATDPRLSR